ncbi:hypothetical protein OH773_12025 [Buttiauxella sp. WJP83]|uniref:hypothetical protein n=1 Tax=Buttiauxella sp. WJP83 TaxID=2986951 RepID=UPI0022DDC3F9|nr:hypothetical protein [Buttiauxella sp. WJP83]WBM68930.1 hypothetical protein OH773_12025 [Buttiauxella sp. WJP83]
MKRFLKFATIVLLPTIFLAGCVIAEPAEYAHHHRVKNQSQDAQGVPESQQSQQLDETIDCSLPLPVDAVNSQIDAYDRQCL